MDGTSKRIKEILHGGNHYIVPGYQRNYQWEEDRWQSLVSDILVAATSADNAPPHWLGILLLSQSTDAIHPGFLGRIDYEVIDGQQRLTTIALWVAALVHHSEDVGNPVEFPLDEASKISVQESDKPAFEIAMSNKWRQNENFSLQDHQIIRAYSYFRFLLWLGQEAIAEEDPVKLPKFKKPNSETAFEDQWQTHLNSKNGRLLPRGAKVETFDLLLNTLNKVSIFSLIHNPVIDETQAIVFDTLNGKRQELEPLDHVRNSLFVRIENLEAKNIYTQNWYPAETALRDVSIKNMKPGKAFVYDYVISKGEKKRQKNINANRGASHFATMTKRILSTTSLVDFIKKDLVPAMHAWQVVVRAEDKFTLNGITVRYSNAALQHMTNVRDLSVGPANPVVLHYATGFALGKITDEELCSRLFLLENFLVRQILGGRAMSPLRARLMDLMGAIDGDYSLEKLKKALYGADWVSDAELLRDITTHSLYESGTPKSIGAIFRGIERQLSGAGYMQFVIGKIEGTYSIEHIYPQKNIKWLDNLADWGADPNEMDKRVHALGNLTVVTKGHNSSVGNKTFQDKQKYPTVEGNAAPLGFNKDWLASDCERWTPPAIDKRSIKLVKAALDYWVDVG